MAKQFDQILDECLDRIIHQGETVEACLARYPGLAVELEPHLRLSTRMAQTYAFTPSTAAKNRGRQRLQAEAREFQATPQKKGISLFSWPSVLLSRNLGWAATAAAVLLIALLAGAGTVAASNSAAPGDLLYPVKLTTEQARLATRFSQEGKAELHLAYAGRRADEVSALIRGGDTTHLAATLDSLTHNLTQAARITTSIPDDQAAAGLTSQIESGGSQALAGLQLALQDAPAASQQAASDAFQTSSAAYSAAIEAAPARSPAPVVTAKGTLQFWATDPPPPGVEKLLVEVGGIEVHRVAGADSRWVVVTEEAQTFDLLRVAEIQKFLGEQKVDPGTYSRVRFRVTGATAVTAGVEHPVKVPSESISLTRPFRVEADKTTVVTLDFDGSRSLHVAGQDKYVFTPQVHVLAQEPGQERRKSDEPKRQEGEKPQKERGQPPKRGVPAARAELDGIVEAKTGDSLVIGGKRISINSNTQAKDTWDVGEMVRVEVIIQPDGGLLAIKIEGLKERQRRDKPRSENPPRAQKAPDGPDPRKTPGATGVHLTGNLEALGARQWTIDGQTILPTEETRMEGSPAVGLRVQVDGAQQPDGRIVAVAVKVLGGRPETEPAPDKKDGPAPVKPPDESKKKDWIQLRGTLSAIGISQCVVNGETVVVTDETAIKGTPVVGATVAVEGVRQPDGAILAQSVKPWAGLPIAEPKPRPAPAFIATPRAAPAPTATSGLPPTPTRESSITPTPRIVHLQGKLQKIQGANWRVSGHTVLVKATVPIEGDAVIGSRVQVDGVLTEDGEVVATRVKVLDTRS